ncbi:MAG TPA: hypothetical protein DIT97_22525, partial [Gimesia maris]|nr:hypothetical protein [Gimesia maris]
MNGNRLKNCYRNVLIGGICIAALVCLFHPTTGYAADNQVWELSPSLRIEETSVSGSDTTSWPAGNWFPVPLKKYQLLKKKAQL